GAVDPGLQPPDRLVDLAQALRLHLHDREVHLLDEIVNALLLGVLHGRGLDGEGVAQGAQLVLDLPAPVLEHGLQHLEPLVIGRLAALGLGRLALGHRYPPISGHEMRQPSFSMRNVCVLPRRTRRRASPSPLALAISLSKSSTLSTSCPFTLTMRSPRWRPASSAASPASTLATTTPSVPRGSPSRCATLRGRSRRVLRSCPRRACAASSRVSSSGKVPRVSETVLGAPSRTTW